MKISLVVIYRVAEYSLHDTFIINLSLMPENVRNFEEQEKKFVYFCCRMSHVMYACKYFFISCVLLYVYFTISLHIA